MNMTHNENIKTSDDIAHHLELEDERLEAAKSSGHTYVAEVNMHGTLGSKCNRGYKSFKKGKRLFQMLRKARPINTSEVSMVV